MFFTYLIIVHSKEEGIAGGIAERSIAVAWVVIKVKSILFISKNEMKGVVLKFVSTKLCCDVCSSLQDIITSRGVHIVDRLKGIEISVWVLKCCIQWNFHCHSMIVTTRIPQIVITSFFSPILSNLIGPLLSSGLLKPTLNCRPPGWSILTTMASAGMVGARRNKTTIKLWVSIHKFQTCKTLRAESVLIRSGLLVFPAPAPFTQVTVMVYCVKGSRFTSWIDSVSVVTTLLSEPSLL